MQLFKNSLLLLTLFLFAVTACSDNGDADEIENDFTGNVESYELHSANDSGISGVVVFEERTDGSTLVTIQLEGTSSGDSHPAHIHENSVAEGGGVAVPFNNVDGATGISETVVDEVGGSPDTFSQLIGMEAHVNVHLSDDDLAVIAEGDIGDNALTGQYVSYELQETAGSGISGHVLFEERMNGNTLATIELQGTSPGNSHPAHIHENSVAEGGGVAVPFNNVDGDTGISETHIDAGQTAENLTYSALLNYNGHVNVHRSDDDFAVIAEGNIGENANGNGDQENGNDDDDDGNGDDDDNDNDGY